MTTLWYSIRISGMPDINNGGTFFDGYFSVVLANPTDTQGIINHFYVSTNCNTDIYADNDYAGADSFFYINNKRFSSNGVNITSIPAFVNTIYSRNFYNMYSIDGIFFIYISPPIISSNANQT